MPLGNISPPSLAAAEPSVDIAQISSGYGSNYTYEVSGQACKVYWMHIWHQYNTKQFSYLRDDNTNIWYFCHGAEQYKMYFFNFDPPLEFDTSCNINIAAMGRAMIGYANVSAS